MSRNGELEELLKDGDAGKEALNRRIAAHFEGADFDPAGRVRGRVAAGMRAVPAAPRYRLAIAACAAAAAVVLLVHRRGPAPETLISPDWRADYNYPSYCVPATATHEELPSPDWRSEYNFPSFGM